MKSGNLLLTVLGSLIITMSAVAPAAAANFTLSVTVTGLTSGTLVMQDNKTDTLNFTTNTTQTFTQTYASGASYTVRVKTQPAGQTCTLSSNATGSITANTTVTATCSTTSTNDTISVAVTGLSSGSLVMQDSKNETLTFTSNSTQTFPTAYSSGSSYTVRVKTQPAGQTCTLSSNATGTITSNITVTATCGSTSTNDTISVSVSGLTGTLVVKDDKSDQLTFTANGSQTFATAYANGSTYSVSVLTQPAGQTCTLGSNASGTITANITVTATCTATSSNFTISVAVTGLTSGTLAMQDNKTETLNFTTNSTQTFPTAYANNSSYTVRVKTQPAGQTCTLSSNATGTITANTTVTATCAPKTSNFTLSVAASGLVGTLVVKDDKTDQLTFTANGTQTFATLYASGSTYSVSIQTQPSGQTCTLSGNASGTITANTTVTATCVSSNFTISVAATGLTGTLVVKDDKADQLTFTTNNTQTFASTYASGSPYTVSIQTQPSGQTCTLSGNASGTIAANTTVTATCTTTTQNFTLSVAATGLSGTLVVQDNKSDQLTFTTNSTQAFATQYASGSTYSVTIQSQPAGQTCTLSGNASGTIAANTTVTANCVSNFTLSVAVTGLNGTLVMQDDKIDTLTFTTNNTQTFASTYASGSTYSVSVQTQPAGQTCTLSANASGTIAANTTVTATCANSGSGLTLSVAVTGLSGSVTMQDDQGDTLTFSSSTTKTFTKTYTTGATYTFYVTSQPSAQSCTPTYTTGTINSNVTINAACATGATRALGTVSAVSTIACQGGLANGVCQQMTVSCPNVPDVFVFLKTNSPAGTPIGTVTWGTGTGGNGLYESIFTDGKSAIQSVLTAGYKTVQIDWGTPFNTTQPAGWVIGPGGLLAAACHYATVTQWIYDNIQANTNLPYCATANSGGAGALAYTLSQYPNKLSMAEVTSGPPPGRLDWGCGCLQGKVAVSCGTATTLGTCFGAAASGGPVWDPAYNPNATPGVCSAAVTGGLPPGGLNFFLGDSVEAPGANYTFPHTWVQVEFGGADNSAAIPIGQHWFNNITTNKDQGCVAGGMHALPNTQAGADAISNDIIAHCQLQ
jgi:hypothetical protein